MPAALYTHSETLASRLLLLGLSFLSYKMGIIIVIISWVAVVIIDKIIWCLTQRGTQ